MLKSSILFVALNASLTSALSVICAKDEYFDSDACQCLKKETCAPYVRCGYGQVADPRFDCKCESIAVVAEIYDHGLDDNCMPKLPDFTKPAPVTPVEEDNFTCDSEGNKICLAQEKCPAGQVWNDEACMCFSLIQCRIGCPHGEKLDPRESCSCVDEDVVEALFECEPEDDVAPPEPPCELTADQCGASEFWIVDRDSCSCKCDIVCIMTMRIDKDTCSCVPLEPEPKPLEDEFDCDMRGNKICPADPISCPFGM